MKNPANITTILGLHTPGRAFPAVTAKPTPTGIRLSLNSACAPVLKLEAKMQVRIAELADGRFALIQYSPGTPLYRLGNETSKRMPLGCTLSGVYLAREAPQEAIIEDDMVIWPAGTFVARPKK